MYRYRYHVWLMVFLLLNGCMQLPKIKSMRIVRENGKSAAGSNYFNIQTPDARLPDYEKLTYDVRWCGMSVGILTTSILGITNYKGREAYVLEATMKTNAFLSKIYKIEDRFISYMDVETLYTLRHEVSRRDGNYKKNAVTEFDQTNQKAYYKNFIDKSEKNFDIPIGIHDILSAYYSFMLLPLRIGDRIDFNVSNNEKNYQSFCLVQSKALIRLPAFDKKEYEAFLIQPYAHLKGAKVDKGNVNAYFSCEKRRLLLLAKVKGPIFTEVTIYLSKIEKKNVN